MATAVPSATSDLAFAGLVRTAELVRERQVSSRELTEMYLDRIFRLDQRLNAFRVVFAEQALAEADQADARRGAGADRPLLGVPFAIKDDMDVAGEVTTYGTLAAGAPATADSEIVRRLRDAGAVIVGKTNVPELMMTPWTESPGYGATRNPWDLERTPGGSSGGSAAAIAAGLIAGATASDGGGSIRIPAGCCGLVGLKPTRGLVPSNLGWHGLSTYGAITRTVEDSALFYDVVKEHGPSLREAAGRDPGKLKIAVSLKIPKPILARVDDSQRAALESMVRVLEGLGHTIVRREIDYGPAVYGVIARYLRGIKDDADALPHPERLARLTRGFARMGSLVPPALLQRALAKEAADAARINRIFDDVDLVLTPMFTHLPPLIGQFEGKPAPLVFNLEAAFTPYPGVFNHIGQPAISVPSGRTASGFPLAVQFGAPRDGEPLLLSLAAQLQRDLDWPSQRPPFAA
jgi:amidase